MTMSIIETIKERNSVRSYSGERLSSDLITQIENYTKQLTAPFGAKARIELIDAKLGDEPVKLGTYGVISGASHFLALIIDKNDPMAETSGGYIFEQAILYCTALKLGTCWLGGTFSAKDFSKQIHLKENDKLTIISPVGYKREKKRLIDSIMRTGAGSNKRKAFETLFFDENFDTPYGQNLTYSIPLEMIRLAPSATNKQPWRVLKEGNFFHFYHIPNRFSLIDLGIALCHFEQTCKELNLTGEFKILDTVPMTKDLKYQISWIVG